MIEEELLLQYGLQAGLVRDDPGVRAEVLRSVITSLTAESQARDEVEASGGASTQDPLAEYLSQLRAGASIRWAAPGVTR